MRYERLERSEQLAALRAIVHANCEAPWYCTLCEAEVCPRCEPSPSEQELCALCYQTQEDVA